MFTSILKYLFPFSYFLFVLDPDKLIGLDNEAQNLINCLQVLEVLTPAMHVELLSKVTLNTTGNFPHFGFSQ